MKYSVSRKYLVVFVAFIAIFALTITSCTKKPEEKKEEVIKIGAILPLTGNISVIGQEERDGMKLAVEKFKLEKFKVDVNFEDFAGDAKQAISAFRRNVLGKPVAIFASTSVAVNSLLPLVRETPDVVFFAITTQKNVIVSDNVFRIWPSVENEIQLISKYLRRFPNKPIIFLYPTNELGLDVYKAIKSSFGKRIIMELPHPLSKTEFRDDLVKVKLLKNKNKNSILLAWTYPTQTLNILKRVEELNLNFHSIITSIGTDFPPVLEYLKRSNLTPIFSVPEFDVRNTNTQKEFKQLFKKKYGYSPSWNVAAAYDNMTFLLHVLDKCSDQKNHDEKINCIKSVSKNVELAGVSGTIRMKGSNEADFPMVLAIWNKENGGIVPYEYK